MFLATKLFLPPAQQGLVTRPRLSDALDDAWHNGRQLILLSAPPGYGKTSLLSEWVADRQIRTAWLALDEEDNDPARFFQYTVLALKKQLPILEELLWALNAPQPANFEMLTAEMVNYIAQTEHPILLALDDYHLLHNPQIHTLLQYLLDHQPPQLRLALLSREDPPLNLPRLRARRQMLEIRQRDLSFTPEEAGQLLRDVLSLTLEKTEVDDLAARTEGWVVGLHLAALSLQECSDPVQFIRDFSGSHRFVIDYLAEEVLSRLADDLRAFLHRSAVLDRFCPELLDAVLDTTHSREMLTRMEAANLFLVALDDSRTWFRYHHLMADILRSEIDPAEQQVIQRRAALWLGEHDRPVEAVQVAFDSGDLDLTCILIRQAAIPAAESGHLIEVLRWLDALPEAALLGDPYLSVLRAWFLIYNGRFREAAGWVQKLQGATHGLDDLLADPETRPLAGLLLGLQAWMPSTVGHRIDLEQMQQAYGLMAGQYPFFLPLLLLALGQAQIGAGQGGQARHSFEEGLALAESTGSSVTALILRNNLAFLLNNLGESAGAIELCLEGIVRHSNPDGKPGLLAGIPLLALGCLRYQTGELDEAYAALTQSINLVQRLGLYHILASPANQTLQWLLVDEGRTEEALALNRETQRQAAKAGLTAVAEYMDLLAAWMHWYAGDAQPARQWTARHPLQGSLADQLPYLASILLHVRVLAESGRGDEALAILDELEGLTLAVERRLDWMRVMRDKALAWQTLGKTSQALEALAAALEAAVPIQHRQLFFQERASLAPLLEKLRPRFPHFIHAISVSAESPRRTDNILIDPPTARELEILRLVAAGLSNADIAERLYITVGTTKWHMHHVFAKLGVSRRTEAIAKARELGLI